MLCLVIHTHVYMLTQTQTFKQLTRDHNFTEEAAAERATFLRRQWHAKNGGKTSRSPKRQRITDGCDKPSAHTDDEVGRDVGTPHGCDSANTDGQTSQKSVSGTDEKSHTRESSEEGSMRKGCGTWLRNFFFDAETGASAASAGWSWKRACPGHSDFVCDNDTEAGLTRGNDAEEEAKNSDDGGQRTTPSWCECSGINMFDKVHTSTLKACHFAPGHQALCVSHVA
jgi:hypothetical protein